MLKLHFQVTSDHFLSRKHAVMYCGATLYSCSCWQVHDHIYMIRVFLCWQVKDRHGQWIAATPIPGAVLINIADMMQRWTADKLVSTVQCFFIYLYL